LALPRFASVYGLLSAAPMMADTNSAAIAAYYQGVADYWMRAASLA
jgi:hypothetical protein